MTPLAKLIRFARKAAGLTQEELAARCRTMGHASMRRETIARAERVGPREPTLAAICDALRLDVALVKKKAGRS